MRFILPSLIFNIVSLFNDPPSELSFYPASLPYTPYSTRAALKLTHACDVNATSQVETTFPESFVIIPERKQGWTTSVSTYATTSGQFSSNIMWQSNEPANNVPDGFNELFWVWITYPPTTYQLDTKYYAPTIQTCYPSGQKMWTDTISPSEHMAPYFIIYEQVDVDNSAHHYSRIDILTISAAIVSIMSFLIAVYNEYRRCVKQDNVPNTQKAQIEMADVESNAIVSIMSFLIAEYRRCVKPDNVPNTQKAQIEMADVESNAIISV